MNTYKFCNKLFHGCGIAGMRMLPANSVPFTLTSPPFGSLREFGGHAFHFRSMARELWRVTAKGGVVCWHVMEQIRNGSESGKSSEQRLYFRDIGFRLHHTMIVESVAGHISSRVRYGSSLQYLFVLSKEKPQTFNPIRDVPNKTAGTIAGFYLRRSNGEVYRQKKVKVAAWRARGPVWRIYPGSHNSRNPDARSHPALINEDLARDLIRSWSKRGDLVLDPMSGAATTAKMALQSGRHYLGFEVHREYHDLAVQRIEATVAETKQRENANEQMKHRFAVTT